MNKKSLFVLYMNGCMLTMNKVMSSMTKTYNKLILKFEQCRFVVWLQGICWSVVVDDDDEVCVCVHVFVVPQKLNKAVVC